MKKAEKLFQLLLWIVAVGAGGYLLAHGLMWLRENPTEKQRQIMETAYRKIGEEVLYWTAPDYTVQKADGGEESCRRNQPVEEDEETSEEMIRKYGDTIVERLLAENQGDSIEQENRQKIQEEQAAQAAEQEQKPELPAWADAVETEPLVNISMEQLNDFDYLVRNFFVVDPDTTVDQTLLNGSELMETKLSMEEDSEEGPQILIYHTHSQENFVDSEPGLEQDTVVGVGDYLEQILTQVYGYQVIHLRDQFDLAEGHLDRSRAYNYALPVVEKTIQENPSIQVVIDLHRDGVPEDKHLVTSINGKPTAPIPAATLKRLTKMEAAYLP